MVEDWVVSKLWPALQSIWNVRMRAKAENQRLWDWHNIALQALEIN
jgi:hypothetical protein